MLRIYFYYRLIIWYWILKSTYLHYLEYSWSSSACHYCPTGSHASRVSAELMKKGGMTQRFFFHLMFIQNIFTLSLLHYYGYRLSVLSNNFNLLDNIRKVFSADAHLSPWRHSKLQNGGWKVVYIETSFNIL